MFELKHFNVFRNSQLAHSSHWKAIYYPKVQRWTTITTTHNKDKLEKDIKRIAIKNVFGYHTSSHNTTTRVIEDVSDTNEPHKTLLEKSIIVT